MVFGDKVLWHGWTQLELLVHLSQNRQQVVMRFPVDELVVHEGVALVLANLGVYDAVHYVDHGWHLRKLHRHHNFDEKRLLRLREQQRHSEVLCRLRVVHDHGALEVLEDLLDLLGAHILHRVSSLLHLLLLHHLLRHSHARLLAWMRELLLAVCSP